MFVGYDFFFWSINSQSDEYRRSELFVSSALVLRGST